MYQSIIRSHIAHLGRIGADPRHVEGWMRLEHGTLDALSPAAFRAEVRLALECMDACTTAESEELARSYGL